ncbi:product protein [Spatholobus suberectus]|nr:product protein [Spatholobus suberectus]
MEPVVVPHNDNPSGTLANKLDGSVAITTNTQVLHYSDRPFLRESNKSKCYGQPFTMIPYSLTLLIPAHFLQHERRVCNIPSFRHFLSQLLQLLINFPGFPMRPIPSSKCMNPIPLLHPAQTSFLLYSLIPQRLPRPRRLLPSPSSSISIREQNLNPRAHSTHLKNPVSHKGRQFSVPMNPTPRQQSPPNRLRGLHRHLLNHPNRFLQLPSTTKQIHQCSIMLPPRFNTTLLHQPKVTFPSLHQPRMAARIKQTQKRDEIRFHPDTPHFFKQLKGFPRVCMLSTSNQHRIPHAKVPNTHLLKNLVTSFHNPTLGVQRYQRTSHKAGRIKTRFKAQPMHLLPQLKQRGSTTNPQDARKCEIIDTHVFFQSTFEEVQSLLVEARLGVAVYHAAPGDDVSVRHLVEHLAREADVATLGVGVEEGGGDEDVGVVGGFEGEGVEGLGGAEGGEGGAGLGGGGEGVVVGAEAEAEHAAEEAEGEEGEVVLGEGGDEGAPRGGGLVGEGVEELVGGVGEVGLGVEVYEVVAHQWDGFQPGFDDVGMELETLREGP